MSNSSCCITADRRCHFFKHHNERRRGKCLKEIFSFVLCKLSENVCTAINQEQKHYIFALSFLKHILFSIFPVQTFQNTLTFLTWIRWFCEDPVLDGLYARICIRTQRIVWFDWSLNLSDFEKSVTDGYKFTIFPGRMTASSASSEALLYPPPGQRCKVSPDWSVISPLGFWLVDYPS